MIVHSLLFDQVRFCRIGNGEDVDCHYNAVIQGASEMGSRLSEKELDSALEFCSKCFNPASPEHLALASKQGLPKDILDVTAPFIDPQVIESAILKTSKHMDSKANQEFPGSAEDLKLVLDQINGRRVVHREYTINNFEVEDVNGFVVRLRKGCLGLTRTSTMSKVD
jgi:hypothetical protein